MSSNLRKLIPIASRNLRTRPISIPQTTPLFPAEPSRLITPTRSSLRSQRNFTSSSKSFAARYERFPSNGGGSGPQYTGGNSGGPNGDNSKPGQVIMSFLRRRLGGDRAVWIYGIGIGGGGLYYVLHLERVPETGRLRFIDVNEAQERELGHQTQLQTLSEYSTRVLPANHPTSKRVRKIAAKIIESSGLGRVKSGGEMGAIEGKVPKWGGGGDVSAGDVLFGNGPGGESAREGKETEWEVYVIDDPKTKNAFVLPGGKIFVFTGILPVSANDDGLATVLGHEIAHQVARHPAERMSYMKVLFALGLILESLGLDVGMTRLALTFILQLPNSRKSESEADFIGLRLMSRACFDPSESTKLWQRMSESEGGSNIDFLSTHPANTKRIKNLQNWLPEAQQIRASSPCGYTGGQFDNFLDTVGTWR